ncbi:MULTISPECIES: HAD hydrolase-like protein [unclassified Acinetobacter]|uniref:HAD hydrolase-like protein n=1 Tax=unclassified Acinetobacter TaxID=196816 RepID=UPI0029348195|nr:MULTISPECIES: HAD hydrolase-like protein [unclassified Acinetobacter]WOE33017.1 HAD hydrolase-like protein [Acinetobacter sp. SAAs470]WOE38495.1 HAD hydrolase-like protein [Acinetobacter sp. SAAs474]
MIKNILLDLDGTLTDPYVGITASVRYALQKVGHPITADTDLDWIIGPPLKASLAKILNVELHDDLAEQALLAYRERFSVTGLFENQLYPDVITTLHALKNKSYHIFLATAKPTIYAKQILQHFALTAYFNGIYGSELSGERTNKSELIAYILQQENLKPAESLMVGDRQYDVIGARENGLQVIAVEYGYGNAIELDQAQAKVRIATFADLLQYL